jgi:hypothetical protein
MHTYVHTYRGAESEVGPEAEVKLAWFRSAKSEVRKNQKRGKIIRSGEESEVKKIIRSGEESEVKKIIRSGEESEGKKIIRSGEESEGKKIIRSGEESEVNKIIRSGEESEVRENNQKWGRIRSEAAGSDLIPIVPG